MIRKNRIVIDLDAIRHNYLLQQSMLPETVRIMPVVKADAYGHGAPEVVRTLEAEGASFFAVATPDEGIQLRTEGCCSHILVLGAAMPDAVSECIRYDLSQTVFTPDILRICNDEAAKQGKLASIHIKIDTGMNRIGLKERAEAVQLLQEIQRSSSIRVDGIYTHLSEADEAENRESAKAFTYVQLLRFDALRSVFPGTIPAHASNSAYALLNPSESRFTMVRQGISLFGYSPVRSSVPFQPALQWLAEVTHIKTVHPGEAIGYGGAYSVEKEMRVATINVGYGDGYHRTASGKGQILIRGKRVPILGRICMDQTMVDVSDIPDSQPGDEAVLIGQQGEERITAEELACWNDTIVYEMLLAPTQRVERVYIHKKEVD